MKTTYYLNGSDLPKIPVLHDCIVKEIKQENDCLTFIFEDDITYHDGIKNINPDAKTVIIRYHFITDISDVRLFLLDKPDTVHNEVVYREADIENDKNILAELTSYNLEYLYHNIGYCSIIVKLWSLRSIVFDMAVDYVEYEWVD